MQLHLPTHSETNGLYTNTEYDDIRLGAWRVVWSYCPRRHRYVRDLAAPILAAQGIAADDPDATIAPERPGRAYAQERYERREAAVVAEIERLGRPITFVEACKAANCGDHPIRTMLQLSDVLQHLGKRAGEAYIGMMHHTRADLPMTQVAQRLVAVLRELGEATRPEIIAAMGWSNAGGDWSRYQWLVDHRTEPFSNGRQMYTRRVYRLKPEYAE